MSTPDIQVYRAIVQTADTATGTLQVTIPALMGAGVRVPVSNVGFKQNSFGQYLVPAPGTNGFVAVQSGYQHAYWVAEPAVTQAFVTNQAVLYAASAGSVAIASASGFALAASAGAITAASVSLLAHINAPDPHPQYLTYAEQIGFRNLVRNGIGNIDQRGIAASLSPGAGYAQSGPDGWFCARDGSGSVVYGVTTFAPGSFTLGGQNFRETLYINHNAGATTSQTYEVLRQYIEKVGGDQWYAFSCWVYPSWSNAGIGVTLTQHYGSGGSPSADVGTTIVPQQNLVTNAWNRVTGAVLMPTTSGKTLGSTANTDALILDIGFGTGGSSLNHNGLTYITGIQLEVGTTPSNFEFRPRSFELEFCQRYFQRHNYLKMSGVGTGFAGTGAARMGAMLPTTMKPSQAPLVTIVNGPVTVYDGVATGTFSGVGANYSQPHMIEIDSTATTLPDIGSDTRGPRPITTYVSGSWGIELNAERW